MPTNAFGNPKMLCALDQSSFQHYSLSLLPSSTVSSHLHDNLDVPPMYPSILPENGPIKDAYFLTPASGRQRTAQACDKCRERKTKVILFPLIGHRR